MKEIGDLYVLQVAILLRSMPGHQSCLVGGCVRDLLLGKVPKDYDFVTDIDLDTLTEIFKGAGWEVKEEGLQFLVMIVSKNGHIFEIANFRKDGTYSDGRRPEAVDIGTIEDDAARRDFTVNALYIDLETFKVLDPTGRGLQDIKKRRLAFVGRAKDRIQEDALRIYRFYRFLSQHELQADPKSLRACRQYFHLTEQLAHERIRVEVEKMAGTA